MSGVDLKAFAMFSDLSALERAAVEALLEPAMKLADGEQLFCEGQESEGLVLVETGALAVHSLRVGELGTLAAGESLGAASLVAIGAREATATAVGETRVLQLTREAFRRLAVDEPAAGVRVLEAILADLAGSLRRSLDAFS